MIMLILMLEFVIFIITCVLSLDNGLARTPPMGWITWQRYQCQFNCSEYPNDCINEKLVKHIADKLILDGWNNLGYRYVIINDCWSTRQRDSKTNELIADHEKFPKGIQSVVQYVHSKNLLFGIYLDYGTKTCSSYPGSMDYLEVDAKSVAKWKVDYVKMDKCNSPVGIQPEGFQNFSRLLNVTGRRIVFSCGYPANVSWLKNPNLNDWNRLPESCNSWRILDDVEESWTSVFNIINAYILGNKVIPQLAGPGHWNDPDVLLMSSFGLPDVQKRVQFGLWCMFAAPLLIATDMDKLDDFSVSLLRNKQLLAIDQDKGGHQAEFVKTRNYVQMWIRQLDDNPVGWAIACFYTIASGKAIYFHTSLSEFKSQLYAIFGDYFELTDVFTGGTFKEVGLMRNL
ncbi:Alpha-N-acetylgalactosaminidase [Schistosoma japonicum]|uniref:Alpha-galactosidase n=1 Tax=Schistosoma japonicum TaxID=6182 RepID=A0A4Z2D326_SCHJA|nr:Alpha-N-acetylgalactosaminidase [Schistosoma japonicum]